MKIVEQLSDIVNHIYLWYDFYTTSKEGHHSMNEQIKVINERYSCRAFESTPLTEEQIKTIVDATLISPSGMNLQPWHITVVTDKAFLEELDADGVSILAAMEDKKRYERVMSHGGKMLYNAPCLMVITNDGSKWAAIDSGILCQTIALTACSIGLGSCIFGLGAVPLLGPRGEEFKKRLKIPEGYEFAIGVLIGTAKMGKSDHVHDMNKVTYIK